MNIVAGQNAFLTAAILGSGLTLLDRRPRLAGAILGLIVVKPHLALVVPIALVITERWIVLFCAGASALGLLAFSYGIFGWDVWAAFLANAHDARDSLEQGVFGFNKMQSAFSLARSLGADVAAAYAVQAVAAATAVYALIWARQRRACSSRRWQSSALLASGNLVSTGNAGKNHARGSSLPSLHFFESLTDALDGLLVTVNGVQQPLVRVRGWLGSYFT